MLYLCLLLMTLFGQQRELLNIASTCQGLIKVWEQYALVLINQQIILSSKMYGIVIC